MNRILFVLASAIGMGVAASVARPLSEAVGLVAHRALGSFFGEAAVGTVAGGGTLGGAGFAQWFVLRGEVSWANRWPLASALGGASAAAGAFAIFAVVPGTAGAVAGMAVGLGAWIAAFRTFVSVRWGLMTLAAFLGAAAVTVVASTFVGPLVGFAEGGPVFAGAMGALYGALLLPALGREAR